jgi:LppX_LprAFG lipoprotein
MTSHRSSAISAALVIAAIVVTACGGSTAPPLTDPTEIVTAAVTSTEAAKGVHLDVTLDGSMTIALPGSSGPGAPIKLDGTSAAVDLDLANSAAKATFAAPALFNVTGELIVVAGKAYVKTTLQGAQYEVIDLGQNLPVVPSTTGSLADQIGGFLLTPGVDPVKGDDVACGSAQCYTVKADLTAAELSALSTAAPTGLPVDIAGASLGVTVRVEKDLPHHLAGVTLDIKTGDGNVLTVDAILSRWDQSVSISAPPADQVKGGG